MSNKHDGSHDEYEKYYLIKSNLDDIKKIEEQFEKEYENKINTNLNEDEDFDFYQTCENINNKDNKNSTCIHCGNIEIIEDINHGYLSCKKCGAVTDDSVENAVELVQYNEDGNKCMNKSCSIINKLLPQSSMVTTIKGSFSNIAKSIHNWSSIEYYEKKLSDIFKEYKQICKQAKIPKCIEDDSKIIFKIIADCKYTGNKKIKKKTTTKNNNSEEKSIIFRGKNMEGLKAACLSYACRKNNKPLSPKELSKLFKLPIKKITKGQKIFDKFMTINNFTNYSEVSSEYFVVRFFTELNLKQIYIDITLKIIKNIEKIQIAENHTPSSIATGAIFLLVKTYNLGITNKAIANYFNISHVTISKTFRNFEPFKKILLNDEICNIISKKIILYQNNIEISNDLKYKFIRFGVDITKINVKNNNYNLPISNNKTFNSFKKCNNELDKIILHWHDDYYELYNKYNDAIFNYYKNKN
jgi:transcription initiation factor TFIIB